jgi:hypothetical protein
MDINIINNFINEMERNFDNFDDNLVGPSNRAEFYENIAIDCFNFIVVIRNSMEGDDG